MLVWLLIYSLFMSLQKSFKTNMLLTFLIIAFAFQSCENTAQKSTTTEKASAEIEKDRVHPSKYDDPVVDPNTEKIPLDEDKEEIENDRIHPSKYDDPVVDPNAEKIPLGEDKEEINAYVKNIYEKDGIVYVDLDFVEIKYKNVDERVIVNRSSKIRTYIVDLDTFVMTKDCKEITSLDMLKYKNKILENRSYIVIGKSKEGKMLSLNFGCYG